MSCAAGATHRSTRSSRSLPSATISLAGRPMLTHHFCGSCRYASYSVALLHNGSEHPATHGVGEARQETWGRAGGREGGGVR